MTHAAVQSANSSDPVPAELHELALEFALVLQKRAMYPAGHPMLRGAVDALLATMGTLAAASGSITIAVTADQVLIEGRVADSGNLILRDFASHLRAHQLAAIRILPGVDAVELDDLITTLAAPARRIDRPLGTLGEDALNRWRHLAVYPLSFHGLELRDRAADDSASLESSGRISEIWADLTRAALGEVLDPSTPAKTVAGAIVRRVEGPSYSRDVLGALLRAAAELRANDSSNATSMRRTLSEIVSSMSPRALARLLELGGDARLRSRLLYQAMDVLSADALARLVVAGATASHAPVSQSMLRLLTKLSRNADAGRAPGTGTNPELRDVLRRLTEHWTLADPNPVEYGTALAHMSRSGAADDAADQARDQCEPERVVEMSLEANRSGEATERALGRMVVVLGLATALDRLAAFPPTALRDSLIDSLVNGNTLHEQLASEFPDYRVLHHAVSRLRGGAVEPLVRALETRPDANNEIIADLLVAIGPDAVPLLNDRLQASPRQAQHVMLTVFDRLGAWPDAARLQELARHPEAELRREAIRLMLKHESMREDGIVLASGDAESSILGLALAAAMKFAAPRAAPTLMRRVDSDPHMSAEVRGRAVRAIAASGSLDGMRWIVARVVTRTWLLGRPRLKRKSAEMVAGIAGLAVHWSDAHEALPVLQMALASRDPEISRVAKRKPA
jgi:hypothetical protein